MAGGFIWGVVVGAGSAALALASAVPVESWSAQADSTQAWIEQNLGHSVWLFGIVLIAFIAQLARLQAALQRTAVNVRDIARWDQLLDVWIQVFIGIGVVWTAVGMRSALQAALGDPSEALTDTAGNVLRKLVDGGILLALSTTIVGAVGGYAMRLAKTICVGAQLQAFYHGQEQADVSALREAAERIEARLSLAPRAQTVPRSLS